MVKVVKFLGGFCGFNIDFIEVLFGMKTWIKYFDTE